MFLVSKSVPRGIGGRTGSYVEPLLLVRGRGELPEYLHLLCQHDLGPVVGPEGCATTETEPDRPLLEPAFEVRPRCEVIRGVHPLSWGPTVSLPQSLVGSDTGRGGEGWESGSSERAGGDRREDRGVDG